MCASEGTPVLIYLHRGPRYSKALYPEIGASVQPANERERHSKRKKERERNGARQRERDLGRGRWRKRGREK